MIKVNEEYASRALYYLRLCLKKRKVEFPNSNAVVEVYPQINIVVEDEDNPLRIIEGSGVTLLAYLMQESQNDEPKKARCSLCAKECNCDTLLGGGICLYANGKKDQTLDYLQFLRKKYPDIYIPNYKAAGTGFDWADLLIHMDVDGGFNPCIGMIDVDNRCPDFVSER